MSTAPSPLNFSDAREFFLRDGFVVLPGFYDIQSEIAPIQEVIRSIVGYVAETHGVDGDTSTALAAMTAGYTALIMADRGFGSEVYDAVKQIPALIQLVSAPKNLDLYRALRGGDCVPGIAAGGYGVRVDNPGEEKFRAQWHQEFPAQLRSMDGLVFWSPLLEVTAESGPVQILEGSQAEGYLSVTDRPTSDGKAGAYALVLDREAEITATYRTAAPLTRPGDLIAMDFLTVHQSGYNVGRWPRWSMQFRYFNFADPTGRAIGWKGSFAAGVDFAKVLDQLALGV